MSTLREQLQMAGANYHSARYVGDLAADVLPAPRFPFVRWAINSLGALAAAAVVAAILLRPPVPAARRMQRHQAAEINKPKPHELSRTVDGLIPLAPAPQRPAVPSPTIPDRLPEYQDLRMPAMPPAPSWPDRTPAMPTSQPNSDSSREAV